MACGDNCRKTTYRPEIGVGYVFKETDSGVVPVAGATVIVKSRYWTSGMYGKNFTVTEESFITDAEGRYQARFVEKACYDKEMIYCNLYSFSCRDKTFFAFFKEKIEENVKDNIFLIDTIKLYK